MSVMLGDLTETFRGKKILIVGFDDRTSETLSVLFRSLQANAVVSSSGAGAEVADLVISSPEVMVRAGHVPLLMIGTLETLAVRRASEYSDFLIAPPLAKDEVLLRAFRLLTTTRRVPTGKSPTVLAVDDDATTTAIVRAVVTRSGMTCHVAANGREALESARLLKPSAIVLDVNMPYLDGFEVLSTLRNDPETADIPVMMLTSVQQESDIVRGFGLGADDYVVKPFNPMELLARIKRLVRTS